MTFPQNPAVPKSPTSCGEYGQRGCPACGSSSLSKEAVRSFSEAETLPFEELLRLWDTGVLTKKGYFTYRRCAGCGLLYAPVYPSDSQLGKLYGSMAPNMADLPPRSIRSTQKEYLRTTLSHAPPPDGDVVEVGPDQGILTAEIHRSTAFAPKRFWFIEPNLAVHGHLHSAAAPVPTTILTDLNDFTPIPSQTASMAFMVHVLDHLTNPMHHLRELLRCLKPGGLLSIVVHNERSLLAKIFGSKHPIYCPYHPQLFNPVTLSGLVSKAGFKEISVTPTTNNYPLTYLLKNALFHFCGATPPIPEAAWLQLPIPLGNIQLVARK